MKASPSSGPVRGESHERRRGEWAAQQMFRPKRDGASRRGWLRNARIYLVSLDDKDGDLNSPVDGIQGEGCPNHRQCLERALGLLVPKIWFRLREAAAHFLTQLPQLRHSKLRYRCTDPYGPYQQYGSVAIDNFESQPGSGAGGHSLFLEDDQLWR